MATEQPFIWGRAGAKLTPDQIAKEREMADALAKGAMDYSPVGHWSQGLNRVAQGLLAGLDYRNAERAEGENATYNSEILNSLLGAGSTPVAATSMPTTTGAGEELAATSPAPGGQFDEVAPRLIADLSGDFGLTPEQAAGVVGQLGHESAGFGTLQEVKPLVPGSRGGFGYAQWTGPRRKEFEAWTAANGLDPTSYEANYGFLRHELTNTPEGKALEAVKSAPDALAAGRAFTDTFLRPGIPGYDSRDQWTRRALALAAPQQVAAATPQAAIEAVAPASGYVDPMVSAPNAQPTAQTALAPELPPPVEIAPPPAVAAVPPQRVAQALASPQPQAPAINPAILRALSDPRATPQTRAVAQALMQQDLQRQQAQQELQMKQQDPRYRQQLELGEIELQNARNPGVDGVAIGNRIVDRRTGKVVYEGQEEAKPPTVVELFDEATGQPYKATWDAAKGRYERVGGIKARTGMQLTTNPDGTVSLTEGSIGNMPKLTEAEGRNSGFYGRGVESHQILNTLEPEGTSVWNKTVGSLPLVGNFARSEDAQKYDQARRNFINAVLRRESGAVISPEEFSNADQQYFPQPGDGPEVIEQKRKNRETTIQGLKISAGQGAAFATTPEGSAPEKKRLRFNPATGELE